jgi:hypothetical protein
LENNKGVGMERLTDIINSWTFEETIKAAESLMEAEKNMFKWDVLRHLRDFAENYRERIKEYQRLEEQGRLVILPCKVGDTVYGINTDRNIVSALKIISVKIYSYAIYFDYQLIDGIYKNIVSFADADIGKTVFFTKSKAEAKLKELRGGENDNS